MAVSISTAAILDSSDFEYQGMFLVPIDNNSIMWGYSSGALAGRRVGGNIHLFITGKSLWQNTTPNHEADEVYEMTYPGTGADINSAPRATLVRAWGDIYEGKRVTANGAGANVRGLLWNADRLWWAYGDPYNVSGAHDPSVGCTMLNDQNGTFRTFGPWRTQAHSQKTRGYMVSIPQWFANLYTNGLTLGAGGPIASGNANSPWGAVTFACPIIDTATPADVINNSHVSLPCSTLIMYDITHPQPRDTDYIQCGWNVLYDCAQGSWMHSGQAHFTSIDIISAATWIDLPDKQGVVYFGQGVAQIPGHPMPHQWYGGPTCCHNQTDPFWQGQGDAGYSSVPKWYVFDPADLAQVTQGRAQPWELLPAHTFKMYGVDSFWERVGFYHHGGAFFDSTSRLLFVTAHGEDGVTNHYEPRPAIHVWHIKQTAMVEDRVRATGADMRLDALPNPFNPVVTISVGVRLSAPLQIKIFNTVGRFVTDISPKIVNSHVAWDASGMPSGIYIVRAQAGTRVQTKAISLVK